MRGDTSEGATGCISPSALPGPCQHVRHVPWQVPPGLDSRLSGFARRIRLPVLLFDAQMPLPLWIVTLAIFVASGLFLLRFGLA